MFKWFTKRSSVINSNYSGQLQFSHGTHKTSCDHLYFKIIVSAPLQKLHVKHVDLGHAKVGVP